MRVTKITFYEVTGSNSDLKWVVTGKRGENQVVLHINYEANKITEELSTKDMQEIRRYLIKQEEAHHLRKRAQSDAFLGIIKLVDCYHFVVADKCVALGTIRGHVINNVTSLHLIPLNYSEYDEAMHSVDDTVHPSIAQSLDSQYRSLLQKHFEQKSLYFSNSTDLTHSAQASSNLSSFDYTFNYYSANTFLTKSSNCGHWITPCIQGYVGVAMLNGLKVSLIARRSRHFAGTRFNRRGIQPDSQGYVANEVESELIMETENAFVSLRIIRGSVPIFWTQREPYAPKPEITLWKKEQENFTGKLHFNRLIDWYGHIVLLNLVKLQKSDDNTAEEPARSPSPMERFSVSFKSFSKSVGFNVGDTNEPMLATELMNLVEDIRTTRRVSGDGKASRIELLEYDFHTHRRAGIDVLPQITDLLRSRMKDHCFYYKNLETSFESEQRGIVRVNCVDCLDRTNVAQYAACASVLPDMLAELDVEMSADVEDRLRKLFYDHGNAIARQYGGSDAMHSEAMKSPRDSSDDDASPSVTRLSNAFTAVKRYYTNNITDADRQRAYDIFTGAFIPGVVGDSIWHSWGIRTSITNPTNHVEELFPISEHKLQSVCLEE